MKTALTVVTTAILTAVAFLFLWQQGYLGSAMALTGQCPTTTSDTTQVTSCLLPEEGSPCLSPRQSNVKHGESILSYATATNGSGIDCTALISTCNDGAWLYGNTPHPHQSCVTSGSTTDQPCQIGDVLVPHTSSYTYYKSEENDAGETFYEQQVRTCENGALGGDATYSQLNLIEGCALPASPEEIAQEVVEEIIEEVPVIVTTPTPTPQPKASQQPRYNRCPGPFGGVWEHGKSGTAYLQASVPYGSSCQSVPIICGYGSLRQGTNVDTAPALSQKVYSSCEVSAPVNCESPCGEVEHGKQVNVYPNATIPHGNGETCESTQIQATCNNGTLSPVSAASAQACSCKIAEPVGCTAPDGSTVAHAGSLTLYQYPEVQALAGDGSDTCVRQWRQCLNGTWADFNGNPSSFTFKYETCTVLPPPAGGGEGGEGVPQA